VVDPKRIIIKNGGPRRRRGTRGCWPPQKKVLVPICISYHTNCHQKCFSRETIYVIVYVFLHLNKTLFQNDSIEPRAFTFDKFYKIYKTLCPRTDIDELFQKMWVGNRAHLKILVEQLKRFENAYYHFTRDTLALSDHTFGIDLSGIVIIRSHFRLFG
jgi:hypothetical protein